MTTLNIPKVGRPISLPDIAPAPSHEFLRAIDRVYEEIEAIPPRQRAARNHKWTLGCLRRIDKMREKGLSWGVIARLMKMAAAETARTGYKYYKDCSYGAEKNARNLRRYHAKRRSAGGGVRGAGVRQAGDPGSVPAAEAPSPSTTAENS